MPAMHAGPMAPITTQTQGGQYQTCMEFGHHRCPSGCSNNRWWRSQQHNLTLEKHFHICFHLPLLRQSGCKRTPKYKGRRKESHPGAWPDLPRLLWPPPKSQCRGLGRALEAFCLRLQRWPKPLWMLKGFAVPLPTNARLVKLKSMESFIMHTKALLPVEEGALGTKAPPACQMEQPHLELSEVLSQVCRTLDCPQTGYS